MPFDDQAAVTEPQNFVDQTAVLVAVVDDDGVDAPVDGFDDEMQAWDARATRAPVATPNFFPTPITLGQ